MLRNFRIFICFALYFFAWSDLLWAQIAVPLDSGQKSTAILFQFNGKAYVLGLADFVSTSENQRHSMTYQGKQTLLSLVSSDWGHGLALFQAGISPENLPELRATPPELLMELSIAGHEGNLMVKRGERHDFPLLPSVFEVEVSSLRTSFAGHPVLKSDSGGFVGLMTHRWIQEVPNSDYLLHSETQLSDDERIGSGIVIPADHIINWMNRVLQNPTPEIVRGDEQIQQGRWGVFAARAFWTVANYATIGVTTALAGKVDPFGIGGETRENSQHVTLRVTPTQATAPEIWNSSSLPWVRLLNERLRRPTDIDFLYRIRNGKAVGINPRTMGEFFRLAYQDRYQVLIPYQGHSDEPSTILRMRHRGNELIQLLNDSPEFQVNYLDFHNRYMTLSLLLQSENIQDITPEIVTRLIEDAPFKSAKDLLRELLADMMMAPPRCESLFVERSR